jgi:hypothetical protein
MYQCMAQPIYQTLETHICSQPQSPLETRPPLPLFFPKQAAAHLPRWCWSSGWRRSGSAAALCKPDDERGHAAHLGCRHLLAPGGRSAVCPSRLRPFLAQRLHGTLTRQRLTPQGRPAVISFIYSLSLIMIHPSRPFFLLFTHALYLCENKASSELTRSDEDRH